MYAPKFVVFAVVGLALGACVASPNSPAPGPMAAPGPREGAGAVVGAGTGALVGAAVAGGGAGNRLAGAAIGGVLGGLIGNRIGAALDDEDRATRLRGTNGCPRPRPARGPGFLAKSGFRSLRHNCPGCCVSAG